MIMVNDNDDDFEDTYINDYLKMSAWITICLIDHFIVVLWEFK